MKKRDLYYERIPTKLLREDIRLLGTFLGRVIKDQEGLAFYKIVESLRLLSKNTLLDKNKSKVFSKISKEIKKLPPKQTFKVTRAFSHILNLMNLAESLDASRKLNEFDNPYFKDKNQNIFIEDIINGLFKNKSISNNKIYEQAKNLDIGIVLTAHPTEVKRRTLIQKYANLINLMEKRHLYKKYPSKIIEIDRDIYTEITIIWKTDELKRSKPSPLDEARWGLAIIEDSLWDTIPKVYKRLNDIFRKNLNKDLPRTFNPIQFGSWMGGDRDGNPNVTAEVTKKVILFSRWQAAKLYEKELTKLIQDLSMEECSKKIRKAVGKTFEPYRVYLRPIRDKIRKTHQSIESHLNKNVPLDEKKLLQDRNEILKPLREIRDSLNLNRGQHVGNSDLLDLIRRVRCFGINLAKLDIRQESLRHEKLINEVIKRKYKITYANLSATTFGFATGAVGVNSVNKSGNEYIAYCWHSVSGYSKFGSYTGGGNTNPTINVGFAPDWLMVKKATGTATGSTGWTMVDSARHPGTPTYDNGNVLYADDNLAEQDDDNERGFIITSTGFSPNGNYNPTNNSGDTYIYMAFKMN